MAFPADKHDGDPPVAVDDTLAAHPQGEPAPSKDAWAQVSATIREVDTDRVKNCQDDIDNILVFTGLYSAVLTALLVESYKSLQQDSQDVTVFLLQQLVLQTNSFVINDGFINSTVSRPSLSPPFTPSLNAQRVNILWFASLTLSLISASFSIVVKQWLREFLAREESSPRAHLRIRYFRNPGLKHYKVFEIAAFLPLLLQLSLLLLFVGLCFFTANIHESIGNTTLPLVAGWAFFLVATTAVPLVDSACPYKVPMLKKFFDKVRIPRLGFPLVSQNSDDVQSNEHDADTNSGEISRRNVISQNKKDTFKYTIPAVKNEEEIAHVESRDVDILVDALTIDAVQADDELLKAITSEALQQAGIKPKDLYTFTFAVINLRMPNSKWDITGRLQLGSIDMRSLSRRTYGTITYMLALLVEEAVKEMSNVNEWLENSICALLADAHYQYSQKVDEVLHTCLIHDNLNLLQLISSRRPAQNPSMSLVSAFKKLRGGLARVKDTERLLRILENMEGEFTPAVNPPESTPDSSSTSTTVQSSPEINDLRQLFIKLLETRIYSNGSDADVAVLTRIDALVLDDTLLPLIWNTLAKANHTTAALAGFIFGATHRRTVEY